MMRRQMRFAAVLVVVVLALTGFSTSSHGGKSGKSRSSSSGGGGCSNSKKSNNGYHDYDDDDYDSSSGSSGGSTYESATPSPTASDAPVVRVVRCAQPKKGKRKAVTASTVEIRSTASVEHAYDVDVTFVDAKGLTVDTGEVSVDLDGGETRMVTVKMDSPGLVSRVKRCTASTEERY
ncbi:hypothetical protein AB0D35_24655 [Streptomyces sp. NPDC048301]|uniref:hypothetical protein n=1 Tax=Streptomyces sp. NPDC048301 TaxID=3155631 RepID=UPI0034297495